MTHVAKLLLLLIIISTSLTGCSPKILRCKVPYTEVPVIDNSPCELGESYNTCTKIKVVKNYEAQKKYAEVLLENTRVCQ